MEEEVPGGGSKRNSGNMVRHAGGSGGSSHEKGRNPPALSREGVLIKHSQGLWSLASWPLIVL